MKTNKVIILSAVAGMILAACDKTDSVFETSGKKGAFLSIGSARIVAPEDIVFKSSTDLESDPVTVFEDPENGTSISVTTTVSPMSSDAPKTRVTETTTSTLGDFTVNGFLGDDILTCRGASDADKSNRHFITDAVASKSNGKWYFGSPAPQWRSCVDHHFWAYDGTPLSFSVPITDASREVNDFKQASFSYTNTGEEDLIMAYQHHYWVDETDGTKIDNEDAYPIENLKFQHALSEVVIDFSELVFKQIMIYGDGRPQEYVLCSDYPASDPNMNPRLSVTEIKMMTPSKGTCAATAGSNGVSFDWTCSTSQDDYLAVECTDVTTSDDKIKSIFVIPQSPQNNVVMFMIYDKWRDITTPFFIQLPAMTDNSEWQPGYRYTYTLQGTLVAPYYTPLGYFDTGFKGKDFQSVAVMKNLMSKYVKEIKVTWKGLAVVNSNDTPEALIYETGTTKPTADKYPSANYSDTDAWKDNDNVGFLTNCKHNVIANPPKKGKILEAGSTAADYKCEANFVIPDTFDPPITFWLIYNGDNNGNAGWELRNVQIEVLKFKAPIQIIP